MSQRGKKHLIDFDDKERTKLKTYFRSLDTDGSGSIGIDELEEPLISLGIAETKEQVTKIVDAVDKDHEIQFAEFIKILKMKNAGNQSAAVVDFFKGSKIAPQAAHFP